MKLAPEVLCQKPEDEVLVLTRLAYVDGGVSFSFRTRRWWSDGEVGELLVRLQQLVDSEIALTPGAAVAEVSVSEDHPILWEYGPRGAIFGQDALPDPYRFFLEFHRETKDKLQSPRDPTFYLNWRGSMNKWLELVYARTFSLMTAPIKVAQVAAELLEAQAASYILLPEPAKTGAPLPELVFSFDQNWVAGSGLILESEA